MENENEELKQFGRIAAFWLCLLGLGILFAVAIAQADEIVIQGNPTQEQRNQDQIEWQERQAKAKAMYDGEIQRAHELAIERAKIEVQVRLQDAGAPKINVSAIASNINRNRIENANEQTN